MNTVEVKIQSLIWPVLFFVGGICCSTYDFQGWSVTTIIVISALFIFVIALYLFQPPLFLSFQNLICLLLFFAAGWTITTLQDKSYEQYSSELNTNPNPMGIITDISRYTKMDRIGVEIPVKDWWSPKHHFNINLLEKGSSFREGQTIQINRTLEVINSEVIPFSFKAKEYWRLQNTSHEVFLYRASDILLIKDKNPTIIDKIRRKGLDRIDSLYPDPAQAGILQALLLGQKDGITKAVKSHFKNAGLLHVLAVSGLHVGIVLGLLYLILYPIKLIFPSPVLHYVLIIGTLWGYAAITGMNIPVVRAVILMTFYLTANKVYRQIHKWNIYFWAVIIILLINPQSLFSVSFQLSFGAVAAILLFYKHINQVLEPVMGQNYFSGLIAVSLAAQLGVLPFLLWHFQELSLVGTLSSLLVIPLLFPLILFTAASLLVPASWDALVWILTGISRTIVELIIDLSNLLAGWTFSSVVFVWHPFTIISLMLAILIGGLYLETIKSQPVHWARNLSMCFLLLCVVIESVNIYYKRTVPIAIVFEYKNQSITELYYRGSCYSNLQATPPPFLQRIRMKYYTRNNLPVIMDGDWKKVSEFLEENTFAPDNRNLPSIHIQDFIRNDSYVVKLNQPFPKQIEGSDQNRYIPIQSSYKRNENE